MRAPRCGEEDVHINTRSLPLGEILCTKDERHTLSINKEITATENGDNRIRISVLFLLMNPDYLLYFDFFDFSES